MIYRRQDENQLKVESKGWAEEKYISDNTEDAPSSDVESGQETPYVMIDFAKLTTKMKVYVNGLNNLWC